MEIGNKFASRDGGDFGVYYFFFYLQDFCFKQEIGFNDSSDIDVICYLEFIGGMIGLYFILKIVWQVEQWYYNLFIYIQFCLRKNLR